jgi:phosphate:Na+ symporter
LVNVVFNVAGVAAALPLAPALAELVSWTTGSFPRQVANAHGLFNLITALAALPLAGPVGRWLERGMDAPAAKRARVRGGAIWWRRG